MRHEQAVNKAHKFSAMSTDVYGCVHRYLWMGALMPVFMCVLMCTNSLFVNVRHEHAVNQKKSALMNIDMCYNVSTYLI